MVPFVVMLEWHVYLHRDVRGQKELIFLESGDLRCLHIPAADRSATDKHSDRLQSNNKVGSELTRQSRSRLGAEAGWAFVQRRPYLLIRA